MYRKAEYQLLNMLSWVSLACVAGSLALAGLYFFKLLEPYKQFSLVLLLLSLFFELQVFMFKVTVMEKRMLHLVQVSEQHFAVGEKRKNLQIVIFYIFFWVALLAVIFAFMIRH